MNACTYAAIRRYKVVKADGPEDLVFQSVSKGAPMRDNNILSRHIKPAARKMGLGFVNWRCLCTSHATWLKMAGADVKDARHRCGTRDQAPRWISTSSSSLSRSKERSKSSAAYQTCAVNGRNWTHNGPKCGKARG
jgi:hypothetical protein